MLELALSIEDATEGFEFSLWSEYYTTYVLEILDGFSITLGGDKI